MKGYTPFKEGKARLLHILFARKKRFSSAEHCFLRMITSSLNDELDNMLPGRKYARLGSTFSLSGLTNSSSAILVQYRRDPLPQSQQK
jgi:hypothetical protein